MLESSQTFLRSLISVNHSMPLCDCSAQNEMEAWQLSNSFEDSCLLMRIIQSSNCTLKNSRLPGSLRYTYSLLCLHFFCQIDLFPVTSMFLVIPSVLPAFIWTLISHCIVNLGQSVQLSRKQVHVAGQHISSHWELLRMFGERWSHNLLAQRACLHYKGKDWFYSRWNHNESK